MVSEQPTRKVVREFLAAGWSSARTRGSHSTWKCATGRHSATLPDGHKTISPGVYRKAKAKLNQCTCTKEDQ